MSDRMIGVIGGSGVYDIAGLERRGTGPRVDSPWGAPSDDILTGTLGVVSRMAFLPRHGRGHVHSPSYSALPRQYRCAETAGRDRRDQRLGLRIVSRGNGAGRISSSLISSSTGLLPAKKAFFGTGCVAHVSVAHPTCARIGDACEAAARDAGVTVHRGGTYLAMEGPQFSTLAESKMYREVWGCDVIGMTNMPEAKLAREAELCYASVAMITDYDSWQPGSWRGRRDPDHRHADGQCRQGPRHGHASACADERQRIRPAPHGCDRALEFAVLTAP